MEKKFLNERTLQEIIRRIAAIAQPERIILFGSAARGEIGPNSDADLGHQGYGTSWAGSWGRYGGR